LIPEKLLQTFYSYLLWHFIDISLVPFSKPPTTLKEEFQVMERMVAHSQFCSSGDNTLEGTEVAIKDVASREGDEHFVFVVSDANLARYGINPKQFAKSKKKKKKG
jgi:hypothetical protein